ncbi:M43 family zinc metalloprotease [Flavobacterium sp. CAU 1735]|uniref:M43 family zinc metalloprotease n=1 Tax=Flavobacterium sp. CAU 1735 TaxID=3140361 RepID=UPI00326077F8
MKRIVRKLFFWILLFLILDGKAQEIKQQNQKEYTRCYTVENEFFLQEEETGRATINEFETWLAPLVEQVKEGGGDGQNSRMSSVIRIPVVVHVIHNGQEVGVGSNIADEQVLSQIEVLNQDFRKKVNTPGYNENPVGVDTEIEFCLAQRTPDGNPTNGIDRVNTGVSGYTSRQQVENVLKPATVWDSERYLNIWVINIEGTGEWSKRLGYAQPPSASRLTGLRGPNGMTYSDGVVIKYKAFGSRSIYPDGTYQLLYDHGRTATHEIGHWLGLRHIWGDGGCDVDDFCADTPLAARPNELYCKDQGVDSCPDSPGRDMVENYMDYTRDICMNVFTRDQKYRMQAVLYHAPRRSALRFSNACVPLHLQTEAAISMKELAMLKCENTVVPSVVLKNNGSETITSASIAFGIDETDEQRYNWTGTLGSNASVTINLPEQNSIPGIHTFYASLKTVNDKTDEYSGNNDIGKTFATSYTADELIFTLQTDYFGADTTWALTDSAGTVLYSGGPYRNTPRWIGFKPNPLDPPIVENWKLQESGCYTFRIYDLGDDGINNRTDGAGYYSIETANHIPIVRGGVFETEDEHSFKIDKLNAGLDDSDEAGTISLYPNPSNEKITISLPAAIGLPEYMCLFNSLGQELLRVVVRTDSDLTMGVSGLSTGIYFVELNKSGRLKMMKFVKK